MKKQANKYFFTVEGETEQWYFEWLQKAINSSDAPYFAKFDCRKKDPLKRAVGFSPIEKTEIFHVVDRESEDDVHVQKFKKTLDRMYEAEHLGKTIKYRLGYSNYAFELWIVLHKAECNGALAHRSQYLRFLNEAYSERFESLDKYKRKSNFKRVLSKLTLDDVCQAVERSKSIMQHRQEHDFILHKYKGYEYYKENPSLSIGQIVEKVMSECGVM